MDMEKLEKAMIYVERMAKGCHPVNNVPIKNDSLLHNPNVIRCMYFIKDVLKEVYDNGGVVGEEVMKPFDFGLLDHFQYVNDLSITNFFRQINEPTAMLHMEKVKFKPVIDWLKENEYLSVQYDEIFDKNVSVVTEKGISIGMYNEVKTYHNNTYLAVMYGKDAQNFIIKHLKEILDVSSKRV